MESRASQHAGQPLGLAGGPGGFLVGGPGGLLTRGPGDGWEGGPGGNLAGGPGARLEGGPGGPGGFLRLPKDTKCTSSLLVSLLSMLSLPLSWIVTRSMSLAFCPSTKSVTVYLPSLSSATSSSSSSSDKSSCSFLCSLKSPSFVNLSGQNLQVNTRRKGRPSPPSTFLSFALLLLFSTPSKMLFLLNPCRLVAVRRRVGRVSLCSCTVCFLRSTILGKLEVQEEQSSIMARGLVGGDWPWARAQEVPCLS